jgi:hypothetical protein
MRHGLTAMNCEGKNVIPSPMAWAMFWNATSIDVGLKVFLEDRISLTKQ